MKKLLLSFAALLAALGLYAETTVEFDFSSSEAYGYATPNPGEFAQVANGGTIVKDDVTITANFASGSGLRFFSNSNTSVINLRAYKDSEFSVAVAGDHKITKIVIEGSNLGASYLTAEGYANGTWAGNAASVLFTCIKSTVQMSKMTVTLDGEAVEPEPEPEATPVTSLAAAKALAVDGKNVPFILNCEPVVVYAYNRYVYVYDGTNYGLIYANANTTLKAGDVLKSGVKGNVTVFRALIELVPDNDADLVATGSAALPEPTEIPFDDLNSELTAANQDNYITIKNVVFAEANASSGTVTVDGESITVNVYNRFGKENIKAATYDITGFISVYNTTVQINYSELVMTSDPEPEKPLAGEGEGTEASPFNVARVIDFMNRGEYSADTEYYVTGTISSIKSFNASYGDAQYYISDDGTTDNQFYVYNGKGLNGAALAEGDINVGDKVTIKGKLTVYSGTLEFAKGNEIVNIQSSVEAVEADNNAPAVYYNLQGMRVDNPANGIYIRRQGAKAVKVLVK